VRACAAVQQLLLILRRKKDRKIKANPLRPHPDFSFNHSFIHSITRSFVMSAEYIRHELLRHESVRAGTFQKWPQRNVNFHKLVSAGFYYESNGDEVICFSCNVRISGWVKSTHAFLMHRSLSPNCSFLKGTDISINRIAVGSLPDPLAMPLVCASELRNIREGFPFITGSCNLERPPIKDVRYNNYLPANGSLKEINTYYKSPVKIPASEKPNSVICIESFFQMMMNRREIRLQTFKVNQWPLTTPNPEAMADSGFFYCLLNDHVQCAFCRCVIGGWSSESNPLEVHRKIFPHCPFIRQIQSIEDARILNEMRESTNSSAATSLINSFNCKICYDNEIAVRFSCKHAIACKSCSVRLIHCPVCRTAIKRRYDVILC
jgi:hypothetical protein